MTEQSVPTTFVLAFVLVIAASPGAAQSGKADLIPRATAYVTGFFERFVNLVADERYVQETTSARRRRELRSDFLLVKPPGSEEWYQLRDVLEVDGKAIGGREERLAKLFLDAPNDALARAEEIMREGSRYNLQDIGTLNKPLIALSFLQHRYVARFRFTVGPLDKEVGPGVRLVQFSEFVRPTIIRKSQANGDLPSRGRIWIEESSGRVVKTQLIPGSGSFPEIVTSFKFDADLQLDVPVEMRENYGDLTGVATYGRFRRFGVSTEEKLR
jgi:hypothetical protein